MLQTESMITIQKLKKKNVYNLSWSFYLPLSNILKNKNEMKPKLSHTWEQQK